jgi:hypothetical protein
MALIIHMDSSKKVVDKFTIPLYLRIIGWTATTLMFGVSIWGFRDMAIDLKPAAEGSARNPITHRSRGR